MPETSSDPAPHDPDGASRPAASLLGDLSDDERLRLFGWAAAEDRRLYLAILRAFERARESYTVQLRPPELADALADGPAAALDADGLVRHLDYLADAGVLERSQDAARVASVEDYKRRRPVYQFTELGWRAFRNVDEVLRARPGEGQLQRVRCSRAIPATTSPSTAPPRPTGAATSWPSTACCTASTPCSPTWPTAPGSST
ncbi:MAG: DUF2397 family protein [Acidimicrobiia bacterium]|nr:DUF2397 family protein [Acidimicrobiia bacterium]